MIWMQRENESADSNHSLSYARSKDLEHWTICGEKHSKAPLNHTNRFIVEKGIDIETGEFKGLLNNRQNFNILRDGTIVVTYLMKNDKGLQVFNASKLKDSCSWQITQVTDWCSGSVKYGGGSLSNKHLPSFSRVFERKYGTRTALVQNLKPSSTECDASYPKEGLWELTSTLSLRSVKKDTTSKSEHRHSAKTGTTIENNSKYVTEQMFAYDQRKVALSWFAKENSRDKPPFCYRLSCNSQDFVSNLYLLKKTQLNAWESIKLLNEDGTTLKVWGGSQSKFEIGKIGNSQYMFYYSKDYCLTFGLIKSNRVVNPLCLEKVKNIWDSHNYITSFIVDTDSLYVAGNMHNSELSLYKIYLLEKKYKRLNLDSKSKLTYPKFIKFKNTNLIMLRNGKSGEGSHIIYEILKNGKVVEYTTLFDHHLVDQ